MSHGEIVWTISSLLLIVGALCLCLRRQLLAMILGVELMLNGANVAIVYTAVRRSDPDGLAIALLIIAMAAAEVVVGFSLILSLNRRGLAAETSELTDLAG